MTNLNTDLRLLSNRKAIELNSLSNLNAYDLRSAQIKINWKYEVIIEALSELVANFEAIAPSCRK